jgi:hypothetical protein
MKAFDSFCSLLKVGEEFASTSCPRSSLIRWILSSPTSELEPCHESLVATILVSLLVRQTHNLIQVEKMCFTGRKDGIEIPSELSQFSIQHEEFENLMVRCCFGKVAEAGIEEKADRFTSTTSREVLQLSLLPKVPERLVEAMSDDFERLPNLRHTDSEFLEKFSKLSYRLGVYLNVINVLEKHSIGGDGGMIGFRANVEKLFDSAFTKTLDSTTDFLSKGRSKNPSEVQELIGTLRVWLKGTHLCDKVKAVVAQRFPLQVQELMKKVYRSNLVRFIERK